MPECSGRQRNVDRPGEAEVGCALEDGNRVKLGRHQSQFAPDPGAADGVQGAGCDGSGRELPRVRCDREAESRRITRQPQQPRRVVLEARVVEHGQGAPLEVVMGTRRRQQHSGVIAGETERDRVDREVAPQQVGRDRRRFDLRQSARVRVALAACAREVIADGAAADADGAEPRLAEGLRGADACGELARLAVDREVDVNELPLQDQVADGPADEVYAALELPQFGKDLSDRP